MRISAERRINERGFTLVETLVALALMALVLSALANITAQWLPNWNRGFDRIQRSEMIGVTLQRVADDLASAEFVPAGSDEQRPLFYGTEQSVIFVRTALGPNAGPGLDVVHLSETTDRAGSATVRSRTLFRPLSAKSPLSDQLHFGEPVLLFRAPYRLSFAYAGEDQEWQSSWRDPDKLPAKIRLTVRDEASTRAISTVTSVHVQSSSQGDGNAGAPINQNGAQPANSSGPSQQAGAGQGGSR
jgi:general secretion pathway protein J